MRSKLTTFAIGMAGVVAALALYHLWTDHVALHAMIDYLNRTSPQLNELLKLQGK